ncbi:hypothetical protein QFZ24_009329 [Streptomyces phaeochromogenes]|uniref:hypothetical protein n=1 Tax=Streptomyces phaeochromogenes TaxID=1923 RepID=UPI0027900EF2|nr:hypothetical protein [Streptomyces phaeochromogenes]MDQ0955406.1 hypothetical protein [Streptomyces phaeochromogenes]
MRRPGTAVIVIGLASLGLAAPTTSAAAATQEYRCQQEWPGRDGNVRAWVDYGCDGGLLGSTPGDDRSWGDDSGAFTKPAHLVASSVMNSGFIGGRDVVAFYYDKDCLAPGEKWADNLTDNYFYNRPGQVVNDRIGSHVWVTASECAAGSWLT